MASTDYLYFEFTVSNRYIVFKKDGSTVYGNYTMSADQKTITLENFGVITITSVGPNDFTFTLLLKGATTPVTIFSTVVASVASSAKTDLLCRGWKINKITVNGTATTYPNASVTKFETIFSKAGTYFTTQVSTSSTSSNPQQWQWKDANETLICYGPISSVCTGDNQVTVNDLTSTSMKITETHTSLGITETAVYELSPL